MKNHKIYISIIATEAAFGLLLILWAFWQIYGLGGWRDQVYMLQGSNASQQALDDFLEGKLRLFVLGSYNDQDKFTGTNEGPFEMWIPTFHPLLGRAHRYSTERFIYYYNRKMRYMHAHPEKFHSKTNLIKTNQVDGVKAPP